MSTPRIRRKPIRLYYFLGFLALLGVGYLVTCTPAFFRRVVLPRLANSLDSEVTVGEVRFRPLTSVWLKNVRITPRGKPPLLSAAEVSARYSALALLRGRVRLHEVKMESPEVTIVQEADGSSNLDPLFQKQRSSA